MQNIHKNEGTGFGNTMLDLTEFIVKRSLSRGFLFNITAQGSDKVANGY